MRRAVKLAFAAATALTLTGCEGPQPTPAAPAQSAPDLAPAEPRGDFPEEQRAPDLFGAWLVQSVGAHDAGPADRGWETVLLVGNRQLEVLSQCITIGPFDYGRTGGGGIAVDQTPVAPRQGPAVAPPPQCARTRSPAEQMMGPLLLAAYQVSRERDVTVRLSGPAGAMTLRRPVGALRNPWGEAPPPRLPPLLGAWRVTSVAGRTLPETEAMELVLRPQRLDWRSGCVNETRVLAREDGRLLPGEVDPFPVCERGRSEAEIAVERLLAGAITALMARDGRLTLRGSGVIAELAPLTR